MNTAAAQPVGAALAPSPQAAGPVWVHRVALLCLAAVLCTITLGAVVTSLEVGMAYNTWPGYKNLGFFGASLTAILADGGLGALIEHSHRLVAAVSVIVTVVVFLATLLVRGAPRSWLLLAFALMLMIGLQAWIGAQRVLANERQLAMVHGIGAQVVFVTLAVLARLSSPAWRRQPRLAAPAGDRLRLWSSAAVAVLGVHLFAGAGLRHQQASLYGHVLLAGVVTAVLLVNVGLVLAHFRAVASLRKAALALVSLLGVQLALGLATWAFKYGPAASAASLELHAALSSAHVVIGAVVVAVTACLALDAWLRLPRGQGAQA
ncbi:MAG: hypothetical protein EYC70_02060 [Planctomycetota bacterium]|nr:MAG: hypothetical protein EYC70_02060 [Planctomycetota bacterium]